MAVLGWIAILALAACGGGAVQTPAERGRGVYAANCTACHHPNPAREGTMGPAVAGSSAELVGARVLRGEYPEGYTPKRDTALMPPQAHLEPYLADLSAYLASVK